MGYKVKIKKADVRINNVVQKKDTIITVSASLRDKLLTSKEAELVTKKKIGKEEI